MIIAAALAIVVPSFVVYTALTRPWSPGTDPLDRRLAVALAPGLGVGLASCTYYLFLQWTADRAAAARLDGLLWFAAAIPGVIGARHSRRMPARIAGLPVRQEPTRASSVLLATAAAAFLAIAALALLWFWLRWRISPHGEWDAWAIWNLRARAVWRGLPDWSVAFTRELSWSNPDYPLLVPLSIVRLWAYAGAETAYASVVIAFLFVAATTATVVVFVGQLRGWVTGLLSGIALLGPTTYVFQASCQCADIPLGFFILAAVSLAAWSRHAKGAAALAIAAATTAAALAAWTKNEGLLLLLLVTIFLLAFPALPRRHAFLSVLAGAALPAIALVIFKLRYAPPNYLFDQQSAAVIATKILDTGRIADIGGRVAALAGKWGEMPGGTLTVLALAVALTGHLDRHGAERALAGGFLVAAMLFSYVLVYVITPHDVVWQLATSFDRLFSQLWPSMVWAAFQLSGGYCQVEAAAGRVD